MASKRGPELPYRVVAGMTPWATRWVVASAKMAGSTFAPEPPKLYDSFTDVLDEKPSFVAIVVNAPIGYVTGPGTDFRTCDRLARSVLAGRAMTVHRAPSRATLLGSASPFDDHLDAVTAMLLPAYREIAIEMSPYRQRMVYEGKPELSFFELNRGTAMRYSKRLEMGREERRAILLERIPGIEKVLNAKLQGAPEKHLFDAAAMLWTARRVIGHAAKRLPEDAEWDSEGLRTEIVF